jgi:glutamyl-Q tRNA(Asp) synthetase
VTQPVSESPEGSADKLVFRFAPSPNGQLHLGHAYSALLNADFARRWSGRFLLRIEDIDPTRCRPEFEQGIYDDLSWLGLAWEKPVLRQSEHLADYQAAFGRLRARGLAYPCFCSRRNIAQVVAARTSTGGPWPHDPDGAPLYPGACRVLDAGEAEARIAAGAPHAWRLAVNRALAAAPGYQGYERFDGDGRVHPVQAHPERWGDAVIVRKETPTSYHLSVVVDDARQGITHVVRGKDLEGATDLHVLLQRLLGLSTPLYHHHGLIRDPGGDKLAKSARSESLADLRARGMTAEAVRRRLGFEASADAEHL